MKVADKDTRLFKGLKAWLKTYDSSLTLKGFSAPGDATPAATLNDAYLVTATGTVFNVAATEGQLLVGNGSGFEPTDLKPTTVDTENTDDSYLLHSGLFEVQNGAISSNGTVLSYSGFEIVVPIEIPDGFTKIMLKNSSGTGVVNYVNCYLNDDFTGFLGRSDDLPFASLTLNAEDGVLMNLKAGTKFISFMASNGSVSNYNYDIYGYPNDYTQTDLILHVGKAQYNLSSILIEGLPDYITSSQIYIDNIDLVNSTEVHSGLVSELVGLITTSGSLNSDSSSYKVAVPISIPNGVGKIAMINTDKNVPSYVACYSGDNFTGFLGFSDFHSYSALSPTAAGSVYKLREGTNFISFMTSNSATLVNNNFDIVGFASSYNSLVLHLRDEQYILSSYYQPYQTTNVRFTVDVNCHIADYLSNTVELQDDTKVYSDWGVLMLPESYSPTGIPTRLIIGCHGAGGLVSATSSQTESWVLYKYLVANGFAVMDMNGLPEAYATLKGINVMNNVGSPIATESYLKGYHWVVERYNICNDGVLVCGASMGGLSSSNLVLSGSLKVLSHAILCPVLDTYNQAFLHPWTAGASKDALGIIYEFEKDGGDNWIYDEEKLKGYNPIANGMMTIDGVDYKNYPCPVKIWHSFDDGVVDPIYSQKQITAIRNAGGTAYFRSIPTGGHAPDIVGTALASPAGSVDYKGTNLAILPIIEEVFLWLMRYK